MTRADINILLGCEYTGRVRSLLADMGFNAVSCDLKETLIPGKHIIGDVRDLLHQGWHALIAFPPCTYLTCANTRWRNDPKRLKKVAEAISFFADLADAPIQHIALENPKGMLSSVYRKPDQIVHPYYFGGAEKKQTCLWLKNLPLLQHVSESNLFEQKTHGEVSLEFAKDKNRQSKWYNNNKERRSDIFWPLAKAMAEQWGAYLEQHILQNRCYQQPFFQSIINK